MALQLTAAFNVAGDRLNCLKGSHGPGVVMRATMQIEGQPNSPEIHVPRPCAVFVGASSDLLSFGCIDSNHIKLGSLTFVHTNSGKGPAASARSEGNPGIELLILLKREEHIWTLSSTTYCEDLHCNLYLFPVQN